MGFLDSFFGNADQTRALGLLGAQMMAGNTPQGLLSANQFLAEAPEREAQRKYRDMQLANLQSEMDARKIKAEQIARRQKMIEGWMGGLDASIPAANQAVIGQTGGLAPTRANAALQDQAMTTINANNPLAGIPRQAISADLTFNDGKNVPEWMFKRGIPDMHVANGYAYDKNRLPQGFIPQMNISQNGAASLVTIGPDGMPRVSLPEGAALTQAQNTMATKLPEALISSAGRVNLRKNPDGTESPVPELNENPLLSGMFSQMFGGQAPGGMPQPRPMAPQPQAAPQPRPMTAQPRPTFMGPAVAPQPGVTGAFTGSPEAVADAIAAIRDPQERANAQAAFEAQMRQTGGRLGPYGKTTQQEGREKLTQDAGGKINDSWLKTSYEPTLATGSTARDLLETVQVTRQAMQNLGGTGWSTQAKAAGAAILTGLGIAPKNAELFAANSELFQKTAMERLWTTLNEAKGPQTEGDADRASKTYASLRNTTRANEFILDFAEAKAQRDQIKARFYQEALPVARERGDLSEVDRQWSKLAPSIFSMPSLKRWGGGIK